MEKRRKIWLALFVLALLTAVALVTRDSGKPAPNPPGAFSFAVLGDAPYLAWEELQYRLVLQAIDKHELAWVLHVGDIFWRPCTDEMYLKTLGQFNRLRHPVIYTPGDNEWFDCWERTSGGFAPQERLHRMRQLFFEHPTRSLGGRALTLVSQAGREPFPEFVEHVRWAHKGILFATVHMVGSRNGLEPFEGRTEADDQATRRRTAAAVAWLREAFAEANGSNASAVVVGFHADPDFQEPVHDPYRQAFEPFLTTLEEEVEKFGRPVLLTHGDNHEYTVDHPLVRRTTQRRLENLTRLEVPGSPDVGWVRVVVTPGAENPFAFEPHVIPPWKFW